MAFALLLLYTLILFIRPMEWMPGLMGVPILDYVGGVALFFWFMEAVTERTSKLSEAPQSWLMLGFFLAMLMSHLRHAFLAAFFSTFESFLKILLVYLMIATLLTSVRRIKLFIATMVVGCLSMTLHGVLQAHTGAGFGGAPPMIYQGDIRVLAFGFFNDPNDLALMLVVILPFLITWTFGRHASALVRALSLGAIVPIFYCIYLTNSRGGWLALGVMLVTYLFLHLPKKFGLVLAAVSVALLIGLGPSRIATVSSDEASARTRLVAWTGGNTMLKQWPIFGAGVDRFDEFSPDGRVAHNSFVECWGETGLFGYFFWLGLIISCLKDAHAMRKAARKNPEAGVYGRFGADFTAALVGFMAAAFFLSRTYVYVLYMLFGLLAAMRATYQKNLGPLEGGFIRHDTRYVLLLELLSIPAMYVVIRIFLR